MGHLEDARKLSWWCEACAHSGAPGPSMHPIGQHNPGVSWPPGESLPVRRRPDDYALMRCLCGISLWATEKTTKPNVWARHVAHIRAFRERTQRLVDEAIRAHGGVVSGDIGPCTRCRDTCIRYGDAGNPLCEDCRAN